MKIGVKTPGNKRWEFTYGTYKFIKVQNGSEFATFRSESAEPAALTSVRRLVPVFQGRFEPADMIRHIEDSTVDGRPARCIDFDTLKGDQQQSGVAQAGGLDVSRSCGHICGGTLGGRSGRRPAKTSGADSGAPYREEAGNRQHAGEAVKVCTRSLHDIVAQDK